jgi:uridine phosphorylase
MGFPNLKDKHEKDSLFTPSEFMAYQKKHGKYPKFKTPEGIVFCYQRSLMEFILENHKTTKVEGFKGEMYLLDETNGKIAIIGKFGIGSPVVVTLLEELIAFGVKKFISIGTAGTLQKDITIGSLMICEKAIRDEGTSHHYLKHSKYAYASKEITNKIKKSLDKFKQKYFIGTSWTIDAPYRETVAEVKQYQKEGVATVEMEASALFSVAQYRNVELGTIFTISDSLVELEWKPKFHSKKTKTGLEILYKIAVDVLLNH